ncbi:MAG: hypothetical protein IT531_17885 [Burkholderiales bacterium]|nr:hypothetical protein [Burkholderiales bacterium]
MSISPTRVLEDSQGRRAAFEDIEIGQSLGEMQWDISDELIDLQCQLDQDFDPLFFPQGEGGQRVAPPQITYRPPRWLFSRTYNVRGLFVRWENETFRALEPGTTLTVTGTIVDKYVKKDREFVVYQAEGRTAGGELVFRSRRTHVLDFVERSAPRAGAGIDSGIKPERI